MAGPAEPGVRLFHVFFADAHIPAVTMNQLESEGAAQQVADGDAATAAGERRGERQRQAKVPRNTRYPVKVSSVSSGTGKPTIPSISRPMMAA